MSNMINHHSHHNLVVVKDKLFVIASGKESCEVFDNVCKKFVSVKTPFTIDFNKSVAIGNRIVVFKENSSTIISYDVDKDELSIESCEVTKHLQDFTCLKLPCY